jgi:hypothetical protein
VTTSNSLLFESHIRQILTAEVRMLANKFKRSQERRKGAKKPEIAEAYAREKFSYFREVRRASLMLNIGPTKEMINLKYTTCKASFIMSKEC